MANDTGHAPSSRDGDSPMTRRYVSVVFVELVVLLALWAFQHYFSR